MRWLLSLFDRSYNLANAASDAQLTRVCMRIYGRRCGFAIFVDFCRFLSTFTYMHACRRGRVLGKRADPFTLHKGRAPPGPPYFPGFSGACFWLFSAIYIAPDRLVCAGCAPESALGTRLMAASGRRIRGIGCLRAALIAAFRRLLLSTVLPWLLMADLP